MQGLGVIGPQAQGFRETCLSVVEAVLRQQGVSKVIVRLGPARLQAQHLAITGYRLIEPAQDLERHAEVVVVLRIRTVQANCLAQLQGGFVIASCLVGDYTK